VVEMLSPLGHRSVVLFDSTADKKNIMAFDLEPTGSAGIKQMKSSLRTLETLALLAVSQGDKITERIEAINKQEEKYENNRD
jgi:hypothetical protein